MRPHALAFETKADDPAYLTSQRQQILLCPTQHQRQLVMCARLLALPINLSIIQKKFRARSNILSRKDHHVWHPVHDTKFSTTIIPWYIRVVEEPGFVAGSASVEDVGGPQRALRSPKRVKVVVIGVIVDDRSPCRLRGMCRLLLYDLAKVITDDVARPVCTSGESSLPERSDLHLDDRELLSLESDVLANLLPRLRSSSKSQPSVRRQH